MIYIHTYIYIYIYIHTYSYPSRIGFASGSNLLGSRLRFFFGGGPVMTWILYHLDPLKALNPKTLNDLKP